MPDTRAHHPIFQKFGPDEFVGRFFMYDSFLGTISRRAFTVSSDMQESVSACGPDGLPAFNEEYFEWLDLLESIANRKGHYTFMELGAGYGRWSVRAAFAALTNYGLTAVEAEPTHYGWMKLHFQDNTLDPNGFNHSLIHAAVNDVPGEVPFLVGPGLAMASIRSALPERKNAGSNFQVVIGGAVLLMSRPAEWYGRIANPRRGESAVMVPGVTLDELLSLPRIGSPVDLLDMDIQGREFRVLRSGLVSLCERVKRIHIATHGSAIEEEIRGMLLVNGWQPVWDFGCGGLRETPYGPIEFQDGVQSWVNKRFL